MSAKKLTDQGKTVFTVTLILLYIPFTEQFYETEITAQFNTMKTELQNIAQKIGELESEVDEHK